MRAQPSLAGSGPVLRFRVLGSGSDGNATLVEGGGARVLLDAGLGPRQLAERLHSAGVDPASLAAVLVTHEHADHARGALAFARRWGVPIAATRGTFRAAGWAGASLPALPALEPGGLQAFGRLTVRSVAVPHDAASPVGFVLTVGEASLGHATDVGHLSRGLVAALGRCDTVLVESNYDPGLLRDGPYPWSLKERILGPRGHLSNADVGRLIEHGLGAACRQIVLAHLSRKNNHPELALLAADEALARAGRRGLRLSVAGPGGTGWIPVSPGGAERERGGLPRGERQLRLF